MSESKCINCCATGSCGSAVQDPLILKNCTSPCGIPSFTAPYWQQHQQARARFLANHSPASASLFDDIYGYAATNGCGRNINYYAQFDAADQSHCAPPLSSDPVESIDMYRGLYSDRQLRGWNRRHTAVLPAYAKTQCACGTNLVRSCSSALPYPYAQNTLESTQARPKRFWLIQ